MLFIRSRAKSNRTFVGPIRKCTTESDPIPPTNKEELASSPYVKDIVHFLSDRIFVPLEHTKSSVDDWKKRYDLDISLLHASIDRTISRVEKIEDNSQEESVDLRKIIRENSSEMRNSIAAMDLRMLDLQKNDLYTANERIEYLEKALKRLEEKIVNENCTVLGQINFLQYKIQNLEERDLTVNSRQYLESIVAKSMNEIRNSFHDKFEMKLSSVQRQNELLVYRNAELESSVCLLQTKVKELEEKYSETRRCQFNESGECDE